MTDFADIAALLDEAAAKGTPIRFWWRDDDADKATPELDVILAQSKRHSVPLALAVIPARLEPSLVDRLRDAPLVSVFQHGYAHINHADKEKGERASEFGEGRSIHDSLKDMKVGHERLLTAFSSRFLPVLTPPWNRIGRAAAQARLEAGLTGLTTFDALHDDEPGCINCHIDIINWKNGPTFAGTEKTLSKLAEEIKARLHGAPGPIGLLTHHLDHDKAANAFMDDLLALIAHHPGAEWPPLETLFKAG